MIILKLDVLCVICRFVLDWQPGCNIMQVLFGKAADIMCELHITPGYPNSGGAVLKTVKGANTKEPIMVGEPNRNDTTSNPL